MKRIERFVQLDPFVEWESKLLDALAETLEQVPPEEAAFALEAFDGLGVRIYSTRLLSLKEKLKDSSPSE